MTKVYLKYNYLNNVDSQCIKFSNKALHRYNCSKDLLPSTAIKNLIPGIYRNCDSDVSCLALKPPKDLSHLMNLIPSALMSIIPQNI